MSTLAAAPPREAAAAAAVQTAAAAEDDDVIILDSDSEDAAHQVGELGASQLRNAERGPCDNGQCREGRLWAVPGTRSALW